MKSIGIITIHKIVNYGSVFQAYALQKICEDLGFHSEIIDYNFPNEFHQNNSYADENDVKNHEPKWIKILYLLALYRQHKGIKNFVDKYQHLSARSYNHPTELMRDVPKYDIYMTGSDQLWNPRHTNGDPAFMLHFAPDNALKVAYAASGTNQFPDSLQDSFRKLLSRYRAISVREESGAKAIQALTGRQVHVVLDPTLLLESCQWNKIATNRRLVSKKYILCYFLNYSFDAFPYVDELASYMQRETGYELVRVARPPHKLFTSHTKTQVGASPEDFLALIRDAEIVLTTSFHGTAFAVNYGKPVFTIVQNTKGSDSRQFNLMKQLGLTNQVLAMNQPFPKVNSCYYDKEEAQRQLAFLRSESLNFLKEVLAYE